MALPDPTLSAYGGRLPYSRNREVRTVVCWITTVAADSRAPLGVTAGVPVHRHQPAPLRRRPGERERGRRVGHRGRPGDPPARRRRAEPEPDVVRPARAVCLRQQLPRVRVQVVRGDPAAVAVVPAGAARRPGPRSGGPVDVWEQPGRRARVGERGPAELPQQLQVILPRAAHRPGHRREMGREDRQQPAQPALDRQRVHDVRAGQPGLRAAPARCCRSSRRAPGSARTPARR